MPYPHANPDVRGFGGIKVQFTPVQTRTVGVDTAAGAKMRQQMRQFRDTILLPALKTYPPEKHASRYERKYQRTGKLGRAWKPTEMDTGVTFTVGARNDVQDRGKRYAGWVMGTFQQDEFVGRWEKATDMARRLWRESRIQQSLQNIAEGKAAIGLGRLPATSPEILRRLGL